MVRSWLNVVSLEHAEVGLRGGFTQADHGRDTRLRRLGRGDGLVIYSPRTHMQGGAPLQRFTAIGRIADDEPYRVEMTPEFHPWRRRVAFVVDATPVTCGRCSRGSPSSPTSAAGGTRSGGALRGVGGGRRAYRRGDGCRPADRRRC